MPSQRAIAAALGVTQATVSRALRDDPSIPLETRRRISETAQKMGYRPNALVSALMEHVRAGKCIHQQGCIGILADASSKAAWKTGPGRKLLLEGVNTQAQQHGYQTKTIFLPEKGNSVASVERRLKAHGIMGIILAISPGSGCNDLQLHWDRYAIAAIGDDLDAVRVDRACSDLGGNMNLAFDELSRRQYRRIGLCIPPWAVQSQHKQLLAGYLERQYHQPDRTRIPVLVASAGADPLDKFRQWHHRWRPDALICLQGEEIEWCKQMGLTPSEDLGVVCLSRPSGTACAGIEENHSLLGKIACDIVVNHITRSELGLPALPRRILVEGTWRDGATLPSAKEEAGPLVKVLPAG